MLLLHLLRQAYAKIEVITKLGHVHQNQAKKKLNANQSVNIRPIPINEHTEIDAPRPDAAPVTTATLFANLCILKSLP